MIINGENVDIETGTTVKELLKIYNLSNQPVVVELDGVILKSEEMDTKLQSGSVVEIVSFVGGG